MTAIAQRAGASPRVLARLAGVFEVLEGLAASGQIVVVPMFIVAGDAAATAHNILDRESAFRAAAALSLIDVVLHLAWGLLLYELLRIVDRRVATFTAFVLIVGCALQAVSGLLLLAPLAVVGGGTALGAFTAEQQQALAYLTLRWNAYAYDVFLAFFGFWLIPTGYLIFRSGFLPRIIGVLLVVDGLGWSTFVSPSLGSSLFPLVVAGSGLGEIPLILWLLVRGVDVDRWRLCAAEANTAVDRS